MRLVASAPWPARTCSGIANDPEWWRRRWTSSPIKEPSTIGDRTETINQQTKVNRYKTLKIRPDIDQILKPDLSLYPDLPQIATLPPFPTS